MRAPAVHNLKAKPNLVPLLDLVMQLIMFFLITVNFVRTDQINESIVLPVAQSGVPLDKSVKEVLFLNMNGYGKLIVPGQNFDATAGAFTVREKDKSGIIRERTIFPDSDSKIGAYLRAQRARVLNRIGEQEIDKMLIVLRAHRLAKVKDVFRIFRLCTEAQFKRYQSRVESKV